MRNDCSSSYECEVTDCTSADNGSIGTDGSSFTDACMQELIFSGEIGSWIFDISKNAAGTEECVIFDSNTLIDGNIILYFDVIADGYVIPHEYILSEYAVIPNDSGRHNV
jgi:hypothetical protein